jgi:hypothetical protein
LAANTNLTLTNLDFDTLKSSFIGWMQSQSEFKDYDYTASNLNVLLDLLSYNSHLNAWYTNMQLAESFLDSAQLKSSVISHAKELNYTPRSAKSAEANVMLTFNGPQATYLLQKGQTFSSTIKSNTYSFSVSDNLLLASTNNYFTANLSIFEGVYLYDSYTLNSGDPTQRLIITNLNVDISSLTVVVYENNNIVGTPFKYATTLLELNNLSKVFFVQQAENEQFEVIFGDGVVGYRPIDGATISLNYRVTNGIAGNGARNFVINFNPGPTNDASNITVATIAQSTSGADPEDTESIRYFAPRNFQVQQRATSSADYSVMLRSQFPEIHDVAVIGGEDLSPPQYGFVAVAVSIPGVLGLPDSKVKAYTQFLGDKTSLTTRTIFILPQYTYLSVRTEVYYNINQTALTPENIRTLVVATVQDYSTNSLNIFAGKFRFSRFGTTIDATDISVVGNETEVLIYKYISPLIGIVQNITVNFALPLQPGVVQPGNIAGVAFHSVYSSNFLINGVTARFEDDGLGAIYIVSTLQSGAEYFSNKIGSVNYDTGGVSLIEFQVDNYDGNAIKVYARTLEKDVLTDRGTILSIEGGEINVEVTTVRE